MTVVVTHTTPADSTFSSTGAAAWNADHALSGVGTMAEQNANAVAITGGTINNTTIGATTPSTGVFTTLTAQNETLVGTGQNLLTYSSDFSNAAWGSSASNVTRATTTINFTNASSYAYNALNPAVAGLTYTFSVTLSSTNKTAIAIRIAGTATGSGGQSLITLTATPTRYSVTAVLPAGNTAVFAGFENRTGLGGDGSLGSITVSNAQLEIGSTANTYIPTTTTAVYGTPTLSFSGVASIGLQSDGSLYHQPAGTGAVQAQATTSSATGGNARGANAVDWQTARASASQVASQPFSVISGGTTNQSTGYGAVVVGGTNNTSSNNWSFVGAGVLNTASGQQSAVVNGISNTAAGFYNFIGSGFTNSGTSASAVTTQSGTMNATTAVTLSGSNASIKVGQYITGTSIASDTYVAAISGTSLTLSKVASGSSTSTLSFFTPHGVVVGGGNNQATGAYSVILGGGDAGTAANRNVASGDWGTIGGGRKNVASGAGSTVAGGGTDGANTFSNTASGTTSFIGGGWNNTAGGTLSVVVGGTSNSSSGVDSFIGGGDNHIASGLTSAIIGGRQGTTRGLSGYHAFPACYNPIANLSGVSQSGLLVLGRQTTDATATVITSDNNAASTTNQVILPNNSAYYFKGSVIANVTGAANGAAWSIEGAIMRGANAASTVLIDTPSVNRVAASSGASAWVVAVTADTTNGGLAVTVTGAASTTIRWVCRAETCEVTF